MVLRDFAAAFDPAQGFGACNYGLISTPEIDQAVRRAARSLDRNERARLLKEACRAIAHECLLIPLVQPVEYLACRGHLDLVGRYPHVDAPRPGRRRATPRCCCSTSCWRSEFASFAPPLKPSSRP